MRYIQPYFYEQFCCTADKCPDTCCAGWQIMIDEDSLEKYADVKGQFGKRLRNSIDWEEGAFYQYDRRCAFLNESNLCDLYTALGPEALCDTCRKYPRHVEEYEGLREWSLSLSCPIAAKIILSQQGFCEFLEKEDDKPDELEDEFEDFDLLLFTQLEDARSAVFNVLRGYASVKMDDESRQNCFFKKVRNNKDGLTQIMYRVLDLAADMQECLEDGRYFEIEEAVQKYRDYAGNPKEADRSEEGYSYRLEMYDTMYGLERLREEWTGVLAEMFQTLYQDGEESYCSIRKEFSEYLEKESAQEILWDNSGLQLFVFFVYTYFCGAVYDDCIYSKMALAVHSVEFIRELLIARWKKKGSLALEDYVELSYRYAREIEHSDDNLNALEDAFFARFSK